MNTMKIHKVFATTENGREQISPKIIKTEKGELTAVRIQFKSSLPLNKFSGIELLLNPRGINEFTAIHRHSEYWCKTHSVFCGAAVACFLSAVTNIFAWRRARRTDM